MQWVATRSLMANGRPLSQRTILTTKRAQEVPLSESRPSGPQCPDWLGCLMHRSGTCLARTPPYIAAVNAPRLLGRRKIEVAAFSAPPAATEACFVCRASLGPRQLLRPC